MASSYNPKEAATLLLELAAELQQSNGPTRNGLFLELHRLHDTIFRLTLESHPNLPPELHGSAFNLEDPMPAPQVVRELNRLGAPIANKEIRALYKHMNMARNNMAHDSVIGRVTISSANVKRMAQLATLVAEVLDHRRQRPVLVGASPITRRFPLSRARLSLLLGVVTGVAITGVWSVANDPMIQLGTVIVAVILVGATWLLNDN